MVSLLVNTNLIKMKNIVTILFTGLALVLSSCSDTGNESENKVGTESNIYDIEIENNEKWVVVEEMMAHIQNMGNDIKSTAVAETHNFVDLEQKLSANIDLLTANCTMTGKAHDELHKWLLPFIDLVEELKDASTYDDKMTVYASLEESMVEFNAYFE